MQAKKVITEYLRTSALVGLAIAVSACASGLSKDECHTADWRTIGYEDGVQGRSDARIAHHRKACAKHGVALNLDAYRSGWEEGVQRYCQPGNGYRQGRTGKQYTGVCPEGLETGFLEAYGHGRELYDLEADVRRISRALSYKRNRLADIEVEMRDTGIALVTADVTTEQRVIMLDELRKLEQERAATKAEIPSLEEELQQQQQRLTVISTRHRY